jgi:hypothetical protein
MTRSVLTFFNNKGGVGKTMLAYHIAWMLNELGRSVVVLDLDPQANLTASFLDDERVEELWASRRTIYGALAPLFEGEGGIADPHVEEIAPNLSIVPGDLLLSGTEQELSLSWTGSLERQVRALRVTAGFATIAQRAAEQAYADVVLADVGPNLGAINRAGTRVDRVVGTYDRWLRRVPAAYSSSVLSSPDDQQRRAADDPNCLGLIKHYHSLAPLGQEARKPVFLLRTADAFQPSDLAVSAASRAPVRTTGSGPVDRVTELEPILTTTDFMAAGRRPRR